MSDKKAVEKIKGELNELCGTSIWDDERCGDYIACFILDLKAKLAEAEAKIVWLTDANNAWQSAEKKWSEYSAFCLRQKERKIKARRERRGEVKRKQNQKSEREVI